MAEPSSSPDIPALGRAHSTGNLFLSCVAVSADSAGDLTHKDESCFAGRGGSADKGHGSSGVSHPKAEYIGCNEEAPPPGLQRRLGTHKQEQTQGCRRVSAHSHRESQAG